MNARVWKLVNSTFLAFPSNELAEQFPPGLHQHLDQLSASKPLLLRHIAFKVIELKQKA